MPHNSDLQRGAFRSKFGFLMAAIGSAVGLGNIWGFPYKMGTNGGFAFLIVYLFLVALVGFVILIVELSLGRTTGKGAIGSYMELSRRFKWLGWLAFLSAFFIMTFYSVLGGYCIRYAVANFGNLIGASFGTGQTDAGNFFASFISNQSASIIYTLVFMIITAGIVMKGVSGGIESFSKTAMPLLFVMLLVVVIRSVTLPGAVEGLRFMFKPNLEPFKTNFFKVLSTASGQMFFSLSLAMGAMITYGSYLQKTDNIVRDAVLIPAADTFIAILAGMAVLPAAFALGGEGAAMAGPKLLFITLQHVFESMGSTGPLFGLIFYILVIIAALTSAISLVEVITAFFLDAADARGKKANRKLTAALVSLSIMLVAVVVAADGLGSTGFPAIMGYIWLDFLDLLSEGIMMPLGALLTAVFISFEYGLPKIAAEVKLGNSRFASYSFFAFSLKFVVPAVLLLVLYGQLKGFGLLG